MGRTSAPRAARALDDPAMRPTTITFQPIDPADLSEDVVTRRPRRSPGRRRRCWWSSGDPTPARSTCSSRTTVTGAAATPTPTSSSTTSPCPAATPSSAARPTGYVVRDVGSLNGTYLNRDRIDEAPARATATRCRSGKFKLVFLSASETVPVLSRGRSRLPVDRRGPRAAAAGVPGHHDLEDPLPREPGPARPRADAVRATGSSTSPTSTGCAGSCASSASTSCRSR